MLRDFSSDQQKERERSDSTWRYHRARRSHLLTSREAGAEIGCEAGLSLVREETSPLSSGARGSARVKTHSQPVSSSGSAELAKISVELAGRRASGRTFTCTQRLLAPPTNFGVTSTSPPGRAPVQCGRPPARAREGALFLKTRSSLPRSPSPLALRHQPCWVTSPLTVLTNCNCRTSNLRR